MHDIPKSLRAHIPINLAVFTSLAPVKEMQLLDPRAGYFYGTEADWHTDANTRGSHPNAMRCLDSGGGLLLYYGLDFHTSLLWFDEAWVIPWDLNPIHFRYMWWNEDGLAIIEAVPASRLWEEVIQAPDGPIIAGLFRVRLGGLLPGCPSGVLLLVPRGPVVPLVLRLAVDMAAAHVARDLIWVERREPLRAFGDATVVARLAVGILFLERGHRSRSERCGRVDDGM